MGVIALPADVPATPLQNALWWVYHRARNRSVYNLTWRMELEKPLDRDALRRAWQAVVNRHESLQIGFHLNQENNELLLRHAPTVASPIEVVEIPEDSGVPSSTLLRLIAEELHERVMPLDQPPLARLSSIRVGDCEELLFAAHHTVLDGWSLQLLLGDLSHAYAAEIKGEPVVFDGEPVPFREYAIEMATAHREGRWEKSLDFWRDQLAGGVGTTVVGDRYVPASIAGVGSVLRYSFSPEAATGLHSVAGANMSTTFNVLLASLLIVLARGGAGPDVSVGVIVANRMSPRDQALVGYMANVMLFRRRIESCETISQVAIGVRDAFWSMLPHQGVPFPVVYGALDARTQADFGDTPRVLITYHGPIANAVRLGDIGTQLLESPSRTARADLGISIFDADEGYITEIEYNSARYDQATIIRLLHDMDEVLTVASAQPEMLVGELSVRTSTSAGDREHPQAPAGPVGLAEPAVFAGVAADGLDGLRAEIATVWERVVGTRVTDPDIDFFAAGGRSLRMLELGASLEKATGRRIDIIDWLARPTPAHLVTLLSRAKDGAVEAPDAQSTVTYLRDGDGVHIHLIPGAGGGLNHYQHLVKALPADWRITQSNERAPMESFSALSERFRLDLEDAGLAPDLLVGWSMGGAVAYQMLDGWQGAQPGLAVLDSPPPIGYDLTDQWQLAFDMFATTVCASVDISWPAGVRVIGDEPDLHPRMLAAYLSAAEQPIPAHVLRAGWDTFQRHQRITSTHVGNHRVRTPALIVGATLQESQLDQWVERMEAPERMTLPEDHFGVLTPPVVDTLAQALVRLAARMPGR